MSKTIELKDEDAAIVFTKVNKEEVPIVNASLTFGADVEPDDIPDAAVRHAVIAFQMYAEKVSE